MISETSEAKTPEWAYFRNLFKLISELTAKDAKDNDKANFRNNQIAQKNKNQKFLKTIMIFFIYNHQL